MIEKQFLVDINPDIELPNYELVLCKLNGELLQELHNIEDLEIKAYFANIDEISFRIPFYRAENDGTQVENELFHLVDGSMLVLVNSSKYFVLTKPEIKTNEETGEIYKNILGFSREYELGQKMLVGYEGISRMLYDPSNQKDENGLEIGFLNLIERTTSWRVNYINANLLTKYRYLNFSKSTYLQALNEVQKTFGCLFKFNTIDKTIDIYEVTQLGKSQGLYISDKNFINSLSQSINHDEIKTRLTLRGQNNISVQSINITGQSYIDSFSFYKNTKYMSQSLIDALNSYEIYIVTKEGEFNGYLAQLETLNDSLSTKKIELATLITELKVIESNLDIAISSSQSTSELKTQQTAKINEINNKQLEIDNLTSQINAVNTNINNLSIDISLNSHLTEEQARELDPFIREDEYSDSNYTEDNLQELLDEGKKILAKVSYPNLQFNVDVYDFLSLVEAQHIWDKFILGDLVTLEHEELGFDYEVRLVGYTHNPDNNTLNLTFSNRDSVDDANIYLKDLLESVTTTASTVDFNKYKWNKGEEADLIIKQYVNENLNLARQQIVRAEGQKPIFDERGIWLYKENPDGSIDPAQLRLVNNAIVMTNDNWNDIEWAFTADKGINAKLVNGTLGQFAQVYANQIIVGANGETMPQDLIDGLPYINEQVRELDTSLTTLNGTIINAFSDNYITNIEANNLDLARKSVIKEAEDVKNIATSLEVSTTAITTAINNLNTEVNKYVDKSSYPISITSTNRANMTNAFTALEGSIAQLYKAIDEKRDSNTKGYVDQQVREFDSAINGLQNNINEFSNDNKLTLAEANTMKVSLDNVNAESSDLINIATSLGISAEKTNYQNALTTLTIYLNTNWLGKSSYPITVTTTQRTNVSNYFKDVENKKSILVNKIMAVREQNAKDYTDNNALKQNFYYNRTKITESEGIEVFDNLGNRVLQTGGFDSDGDGVKDMYGHVAYHSDGSLSALVRDGFLKRTQYGDNYYLNSAVIIEGETIYNGGNHPPNNVRIDLPMYMKNRNVAISLGLNESSIEYMGSKQSLDGDFLSENHLNIIEKKLSASPPYIIVSAYSYTKTFGTLKGVHYTGVKFNVMVVSD